MNPWAAMKFSIERAKSSRGAWGWQLADCVVPGGQFVMWSDSLLACRGKAAELGATPDSLFIEGIAARGYRAYTQP